MGMPATQKAKCLLIVLWTVWLGVTHNPYYVLGIPLDEVRCTISGAAGDPSANITCLFGKDLRQPKSAFSVVHYRFDAANDVPGTDVVVCISSLSSDRPECAVRDGYRVHFDLTENATITISRVTTSTEGRYACHLVPLEDRTTHLCEVNATEFQQNFSKFHNIQDYTEATANETQHKNHTGNGAEEPMSKVGGWVAGIVCVAVLVAGLVVLLLVYCQRRKLAKRKEGQRGNECASSSDSPVPLLAQPVGDHHTLSPLLTQPEGDHHILSPLLAQPKGVNRALWPPLSQPGGDNCEATTRCPAQYPVLQATPDDCAKAPLTFESEHPGRTLNPPASAAVGNPPEASTNASDDQKTVGRGVQPQKGWNNTHALSSSSAQDGQRTTGLQVQLQALNGWNNTNTVSSSAQDDLKTFELQAQPQKGAHDANSEESGITIQSLRQRMKDSYIGNKNSHNTAALGHHTTAQDPA